MAFLISAAGRGLWLFTAMLFGCNLFFNDFKVGGGDEQDEACDDYCTTILETCADENSQYSATTQCLAVCDAFDLGDEQDEVGNTVSCRVHYALEAAEDPDTHCTSAGPGGNGVCGSNCESFCDIQDAVCHGNNEQYPTITECISACGDFDADEVYHAGVVNGDSFACRLTHLTLAASSPDVHCPHIAPISSVCH